MVNVVKILGLWVAKRVIKNSFCGFGNLLITSCNHIVKIVRDRGVADLCYSVCRNTPGLYGHNPVVKG